VFINKYALFFGARTTVLSVQRQVKLHSIAQRLALIALRKYWIALGLTSNSMLTKIKKFKRKREARIRKRLLFGRKSSAVSPKSVEFSPAEHLFSALFAGDVPKFEGSSSRRMSVASDFKPKLQEKLLSAVIPSLDSDSEDDLETKLGKEQLQLTKVSYNVPAYVEKLPLPLMQERAVHSSVYSSVISPRAHFLSLTASMNARMREADRGEDKGLLIRSTLIQAPPAAPCRFKPGQHNSAAPMVLSMPKDTQVKKSKHTGDLSYMRTTRGIREEPKAKLSLRKVDINRLRLSTLSFETKTKKEPWKPSVRPLSNSFFKPRKSTRLQSSKVKSAVSSEIPLALSQWSHSRTLQLSSWT
jgi:hypothetical protein